MADKKSEAEQKTMSFWDHLEELRWMLVKSAIAIVVFGTLAFFNREFLFDTVVLSPTKGDFVTNRFLCWAADYFSIDGLCMGDMQMQIININMSGQFMTHFYISFVAGIFIAFPFVITQIWQFVRPALSKKEARLSGLAVIASSMLFYLGAVFSYFLIVPITINFFTGYQVSEMVSNQISLTSYISTFISMNFAMGLVFELPILIYFLARLGIVTADFLKRNRKYTLVILLIIAAIITPPDVFSQILVTIPLVALYEASILVAVRVEKKKST
jgi:sec-independent protein translocase protein TatC